MLFLMCSINYGIYKNNGTDYIVKNKDYLGKIIKVKVQILLNRQKKNSQNNSAAGGFGGIMLDTLNYANHQLYKLPINLHNIRNKNSSNTENFSFKEEIILGAKVTKIDNNNAYISGSTQISIHNEAYIIYIEGIIDTKDLSDEYISSSKILNFKYKALYKNKKSNISKLFF